MQKKYEITEQLAKKIVEDIKSASGYGANVIGPDGIILYSFEPARIGTFHEGGYQVITGTVEEMAITDEMAATMKGTKGGYIGAIKMDGLRVAAIGIRGDSIASKPIQKMAELAARESLLRDAESFKEREKVREMEVTIVDIAERMRILSMNGSIQAAKLGEKGQAFKIVVAEMRKLAEQIHQIVGQRWGD